MKFLSQRFVLLLSGAFMVMTTACDSPEPVATQYKQANPEGAAVAAPPSNNNNTNPDNNNNSDTSNDDGAVNPALVQEGQALFAAKSCGGCHFTGSTIAPSPIFGQNYDGTDIVDAQAATPSHGGINPWLVATEAAAVAAFLGSPQ